MKVRYLAAGLLFAGGVSSAAVVLTNATPDVAVRSVMADADPLPRGPADLRPADNAPAPAALQTVQAPVVTTPQDMGIPAAATTQSDLPPSERIWSRDIAEGDTLDAVLADAGLGATDRAEIALAVGAEFDLQALRPGHRLTLVTLPDGSPKRVSLAVDDGVRVEAQFGSRNETRIVTPTPDEVVMAGEAHIDSSIFEALEDANIPARFAVDLAQMLGSTVDFRRDLSGGETLRLMWREEQVNGTLVGEPEMTFAALDLDGILLEIIWPDDGSGAATIFRNGDVMRVFAQPVEGARLSSVYGARKHPVYGDMRMHTGIDFAAATGTPVRSTAPGRVSFIGTRGGYGRTVEISHGSDTMTRYAHLSAVPDGLSTGDRVAAGDVIGNVGATGTATGPNLHYEVRVDGQPTDPLSDDRLREMAEQTDDGAAFATLVSARVGLGQKLASGHLTPSNKRL